MSGITYEYRIFARTFPIHISNIRMEQTMQLGLHRWFIYLIASQQAVLHFTSSEDKRNPQQSINL
jgi:hypothetical protein